jgi:hypothetical protein
MTRAGSLVVALFLLVLPGCTVQPVPSPAPTAVTLHLPTLEQLAAAMRVAGLSCDDLVRIMTDSLASDNGVCDDEWYLAIFQSIEQRNNALSSVVSGGQGDELIVGDGWWIERADDDPLDESVAEALDGEIWSVSDPVPVD